VTGANEGEEGRGERLAGGQEAAQEMLKGRAPVPEFPALQNLIAELAAELEFGKARKVLILALGRGYPDAPSASERFPPDEVRWLVQELAQCTYRDEELLPNARFRDALALLDEIGLRGPQTPDPETLAVRAAAA